MESTHEKFIILMEKGIIKEIYGTSEMDYAIIHMDRKHPVEGIWETVQADMDIKSLATLLDFMKTKGLKRFRRAVLRLLKENF